MYRHLASYTSKSVNELGIAKIIKIHMQSPNFTYNLQTFPFAKPAKSPIRNFIDLSFRF